MGAPIAPRDPPGLGFVCELGKQGEGAGDGRAPGGREGEGEHLQGRASISKARRASSPAGQHPRGRALQPLDVLRGPHTGVGGPTGNLGAPETWGCGQTPGTGRVSPPSPPCPEAELCSPGGCKGGHGAEPPDLAGGWIPGCIHPFGCWWEEEKGFFLCCYGRQRMRLELCRVSSSQPL